MFYDRKIKYVDVYEKEERMQNAGFLKLEAKGETAGLKLQVFGLRNTDTYSCPVVLLGAGKEAVLGEIQLEKGKGNAEFLQLDVKDMGGGVSYEEAEEIRIRPGGRRLLRCLIKEQEWKQEKLLPQIPVKKEEKSEAELLKEAFLEEKRLRGQVSLEAPQKEEERPSGGTQEQSVEVPQSMETPRGMEVPQSVEAPQIVEAPRSVTSKRVVDKWQQLLAIYPHIRPFEDMREYLMIKPQDFVILSQKYFSLSTNSFLLHGYYNYEHLIMTRQQRKEEEGFYIGVPGNFYDKEKQVAIMFGFECFEGKREPARSGDFGYYLIPVEI